MRIITKIDDKNYGVKARKIKFARNMQKKVDIIPRQPA